MSFGAATLDVHAGTFTCVTCGAEFEDLAAQKAHFQGEYHKFNLKRKTVGLPPVALEVWTAAMEKEAAARAARGDGGERRVLECRVCRKKFKTVQSFEVHYGSRKHMQRCMAAGVSPEPSDEQMEIADERAADMKGRTIIADDMTEEEILAIVDSRPLFKDEECLFCGQMADSFEDNMTHMTEEHSFFVPELESCIDVRGLVAYLNEKIAKWARCIWCPDSKKCFCSPQAARHHMIELCHCRANFEDPSEYEEFYDFSKVNAEADASGIEVLSGGYELRLPDGRVIGHRAMQNVYQQNLHAVSVFDNEAFAEARARRALEMGPAPPASSALVVSQGVPEYLARLHKTLLTQHKFDRSKADLAREKKRHMQLGVHNNKLIVKHWNENC